MSVIIDEKQNAHAVKRLQDLGLSQKEAAVYVALLPYRDIGSSKLIRATGLHGQFVYDALARLEELGLAKHVIQNGRKKFSANTPNRLLSLADEKRLAAHAIAKELQSRFAGQHEQNFEVYQGDSAFVAHQIDMLERLPKDSEICVIASETERYEKSVEAEGLWEEYVRIQYGKNIRVRYLGSEAQRERLQKREKNEPLWTYRILPGLSTGIMNTDIWGDTININVFGDQIFCMTITSKEIADGYRQFFNAIWNLSGK